MPAAMNSAARASGMFSGSVATTPCARRSVRRRGRKRAPRGVPVGIARSGPARGKSSTSIERSKPQPIMAEKVSVIASSFAPDEGVVVERVGDRDELAERRPDARLLLGAERRGNARGARRRVRHRAPRRRPSSSSSRDARPGRAPCTCSSFSASRNSGIERRRGTPRRARNAVGRRLGAGDRGGVRDGGGARLLRAPDRHRHDRLPKRARAERHRFETRRRRRSASMCRPIAVTRSILDQRRGDLPTARSAPGCRPLPHRRSAGRGAASSC